ncbi:lipocalin-like domain-containing protein [Rhizobium sp.]|uniref:lipocalin-like domain-containing protein n=1 Tax=Rhizobium sp. TaxID=391 RepID=UPI0028A5F1F0
MKGSRIVHSIVACVMALTPLSEVASQGFAGLASGAEGFEKPRKGNQLSFPQDHGAHSDFRIEWWYVTANLTAQDGRRFGAQWTLFRSALAPGDKPGWSDPQIWIGHAAVTSSERHYVSEKLARGGIGQAGVSTTPFEAWIDDWDINGLQGTSQDELDQLQLKADGDDFSYSLSLATAKPLVLQGDNGFSLKSASGQASYYYSQPFYDVQGAIKLEGVDVTVSGKAWLDREWSSQPLATDQTGWDWFSIHFDDGSKLMAFRLRDNDGGFVSANWISADGKTEILKPGDVRMSPLRSATVEGRAIPVAWRIEIPSRKLSIQTEPLNEQAWMKTTTPYWEGPIAVSGTASGVGYLEMTGY